MKEIVITGDEIESAVVFWKFTDFSRPYSISYNSFRIWYRGEELLVDDVECVIYTDEEDEDECVEED